MPMSISSSWILILNHVELLLVPYVCTMPPHLCFCWLSLFGMPSLFLTLLPSHCYSYPKHTVRILKCIRICQDSSHGRKMVESSSVIFTPQKHPFEWPPTHWKYLPKSKETSWEITVPRCSTIIRKDALKWVGRTVLITRVIFSPSPGSIVQRQVSFTWEKEREVSTGLCLESNARSITIKSSTEKAPRGPRLEAGTQGWSL